MASDANWVEDVRRWFAASQSRRTAGALDDLDVELGYEAAHPSLQAAHWPDAQALQAPLQAVAPQELPR